MSSLNQLISEIAHSVQQADSIPVRRAIRLAIIHTRNELIRQSFANHKTTDKVLQQRIKLSLTSVPDGDISIPAGVNVNYIKRTTNKIPRPTRVNNNIPFHSVRTLGVENPMEVAFVKEASSKFYKFLPGFCNQPTYDYINEYIYINTLGISSLKCISNIIVESVFEYPHIIEIETVDGVETASGVDDDNEFLLPEDMIGRLKQLVLARFNPTIVRDTNEAPTQNMAK